MTEEDAERESRRRWGNKARIVGDEFWVGVDEPAPAAPGDVPIPKGTSKVSWEDAFADADRQERRAKTKIGY